MKLVMSQADLQDRDQDRYGNFSISIFFKSRAHFVAEDTHNITRAYLWIKCLHWEKFQIKKRKQSSDGI